MSIEIKNTSDISSLCEDAVIVDGQHVPRTIFAALDSEDKAYFGTTLDVHISDLRPEIAQKHIKPLPDQVYPLFPEGGDLTAAPDNVDGYFVKRPPWPSCLDVEATEFLPKLMLQEAQTMEFLSQHPHPNVVKYYGCRVKRGRITGLVLETFEFKHDLMSVKSQPVLFKSILDKDRIMSGVRSGLDHLHSLGLAHNDLNPSNIMLGNDGQPKLIDFGSCQPFGKALLSYGTPGWCRERHTVSDKEHDEYGYEILGPWLDEMVVKVQESVYQK